MCSVRTGSWKRDRGRPVSAKTRDRDALGGYQVRALRVVVEVDEVHVLFVVALDGGEPSFHRFRPCSPYIMGAQDEEHMLSGLSDRLPP